MIESIVQLTNDGKAKVGSLEADATRIYFNEGPTGSFRIAQVSVNGGQTGEIATSVLNPTIAGLPSDASSLLVLSGGGLPDHEAMWMVPLPAGEARPLGDTAVLNARVFPDGRLLYSSDTGFFVAGKDASDPRKLEAFGKNQTLPSVSPDEHRLAFFTYDNKTNDWSIDEASTDGKKIRTVLKQRSGLPAEICCLRWTEDGDYLMFRAKSEGRWDLWAVSDKSNFLTKATAPVRLTNGPLSYSAFAGSPDGKRIFAVGYLERGELLHYDLTTHQFLPFLGGISAVDPTFSSDGKWVAYVSYPDRALWRSRADGSERLQLTYPPVAIGFARISPDGSQVAYNDDNADVYVVSMSGGTPRKVVAGGVAPDWSPDGKQVAVSGFAGGVYFSRLVDVATGTASDIPGSRGILGAWFAGPDALIATSNDQSKFKRYDFKTKSWSDLISSPDKFVNWETSPDNKYFIYSTGGLDPAVFRMRLSDRAIENLVSLKDVNTGAAPGTDPSLSVSPDDSILIMRNIGTQEVYALSVKWP